MRYIKIIILACLLHSICKGQAYFNNYYKTGDNNVASTHVFNNPADSGFTCFNYALDSATSYQGLYLTNISKTGQLNFEKALKYPNYDYYYYANGLKQFIPATACSYMATSVTYTSNNTTILLAKINRLTLDTIKTTSYYDGVYDYYMNSLIKFNDNKYYLAGNRSNPSGQNPCVFQLDSNLNIVNTFTVNNTGNQVTLDAIYDKINQKLIFGGRILNTFNKPNFVVLVCDTLGTITNSATYYTQLTNGISKIIYSAFDNTYITIGSLQISIYGNNSLSRLQISKYDLNFNALWHKTYGTSSLINVFSDAVINADGSIVAAGVYSDSTSLPLMNEDANGVILKVNSNGDSLWMRQYNNYATGDNPGNYWEIFRGIKKTLDGGYIACGNIINQPHAKAWLVKTDSIGCVSPGCGPVITGSLVTTIKEEVYSDGIAIYPNPASDVLNIKLDAGTNNFTKIEIINSLGQLVSEEEISLKNKTASIKTSELPNGIYLLKLKSDNLGTVIKKFIVAR